MKRLRWAQDCIWLNRVLYGFMRLWDRGNRVTGVQVVAQLLYCTLLFRIEPKIVALSSQHLRGHSIQNRCEQSYILFVLKPEFFKIVVFHLSRQISCERERENSVRFNHRFWCLQNAPPMTCCVIWFALSHRGRSPDSQLTNTPVFSLKLHSVSLNHSLAAHKLMQIFCWFHRKKLRQTASDASGCQPPEVSRKLDLNYYMQMKNETRTRSWVRMKRE